MGRRGAARSREGGYLPRNWRAELGFGGALPRDVRSALRAGAYAALGEAVRSWVLLLRAAGGLRRVARRVALRERRPYAAPHAQDEDTISLLMQSVVRSSSV